MTVKEFTTSSEKPQLRYIKKKITSFYLLPLVPMFVDQSFHVEFHTHIIVSSSLQQSNWHENWHAFVKLITMQSRWLSWDALHRTELPQRLMYRFESYPPKCTYLVNNATTLPINGVLDIHIGKGFFRIPNTCCRNSTRQLSVGPIWLYLTEPRMIRAAR